MAIRTVNELLEAYYNDFKAECEENAEELYEVSIFKQEPVTLTLPHIQVHSSATPYSENLSKGEPQWIINFEVEIYTQDIARITRREVAQTLQEKVFDYFFDECGFNCTFNDSIPNIEAKIHRILIRFEGVIDLDKNILFRS